MCTARVCREDRSDRKSRIINAANERRTLSGREVSLHGASQPLLSRQPVSKHIVKLLQGILAGTRSFRSNKNLR